MLELTERWLELYWNTNRSVLAAREHVPGRFGGGPEHGSAGTGTGQRKTKVSFKHLRQIFNEYSHEYTLVKRPLSQKQRQNRH